MYSRAAVTRLPHSSHFSSWLAQTVSFDRSTSIGMISTGVEAGVAAEIDSATSSGEIAMGGDIAIDGATVQNGVNAQFEANATNEPTTGPENATNEPTTGTGKRDERTHRETRKCAERTQLG